MLYKTLYHICYIIISFVAAAIFAMAMYTFEWGKLTISFYSAFALLEGLHILFIVRKQFQQKQRALLLNNIHFVVLALVSVFILYFYSNMNSWRNTGDNSIEFRTFSYFFDNIFLINFAFFFVNFWFLCRNLLIWGFKKLV
ncbi:hypothetical protein [Emticicia sp. BO119]|uniref:hypothetical protein n=1 Tax=Emticicia sp. BO119 TaxID=2757768 RepID=UPI0015F124F1|nr:hypothetical protein [Emticicia sp. BO119]MBA4849408.1 hypothetical protein [Emticicia sp. BO119]